MGRCPLTYTRLLAAGTLLLGLIAAAAWGLPSGASARPEDRVVTTTVQSATITPPLHRHLDFSLPPDARRIISQGRPGLLAVLVRRVRAGTGREHVRVIARLVVRAPSPRIVAEGVRRYDARMNPAPTAVRDVLQRTSYVAAGAMRMVATAYTPSCDGCSGITATGYRAGPGIVAVDPRVIPLGSRLYIPGYGFAVAGDTGGAIRGDRIDLGFSSTRAALRFGRRIVTVYRLRAR